MAWLGARLPLVLASFVVACSGASNDDLFGGAADQSDVAATEPPATQTPTAPTSAPQPPSAPTPDADAGPTPPAPGACTQEIEPNNDADKATVFATSLCGKIAMSGDVDWGRFTLPVGVTKVTWKHKESGGKATYRFYVNGMPIIGEQGPDQLRVIAGATYTVQIVGSQANRPSYELEIDAR